VLSTPPPHAAPTPREIVAFIATISEQVDLPIMVYKHVVALKARIAARGRFVKAETAADNLTVLPFQRQISWLAAAYRACPQ
jgi:hypothetical protein